MPPESEDILRILLLDRVACLILLLHLANFAVLFENEGLAKRLSSSILAYYGCKHFLLLLLLSFFLAHIPLQRGTSAKSPTQADSQSGILLDMREAQGRALRRQGEGVLG